MTFRGHLNEGPLMELAEDSHPLGRKRELAGITPDTHRSGYDFLVGEPGAPSAPDAPGTLALPRQQPFRVGWQGKARAEEPAKDRFEKIEQRFQKHEAHTAIRREFIRDNMDKTGVHPITGEVTDPSKHVRCNGRDIDPGVRGRGPRNLPERTPEMSAFDERRALRTERRRPIREDFILKEGLTDAPPDRLSARDNFVPPSSRLPDGRWATGNELVVEGDQRSPPKVRTPWALDDEE